MVIVPHRQMATTERPVKLGVTGLRIRYGDATALEGVTMDVHEHEIFGVIGPANAGKTSFLKAVNRMDLFNSDMHVQSERHQPAGDVLHQLDEQAVHRLRQRLGFGYLAGEDHPFRCRVISAAWNRLVEIAVIDQGGDNVKRA